MGGVFNDRQFDAFLSHANVDKERIVDQFYEWSKLAGLKLWYDRDRVPAGRLPDVMRQEISKCRAGIVMISQKSMSSSYVLGEMDEFREQHEQNPDFVIIPIKIDAEKPPPTVVSGLKWIDLSAGLDAVSAGQVVQALHRYADTESALEGRRIYLSSGSRDREAAFAARLKTIIKSRSPRVWAVRDAPCSDYEDARIAAIIESANAVIAVASHRADGLSSQFICREIRTAIDLDIPVLLLREAKVRPVWMGADPAALPKDWTVKFSPVSALPVGSVEHEIADLETLSEGDLKDYVGDFFEALRPPRKPAYCFLGHPIEDERRPLWDYAHQSVQAVTGLKCFDGDRMRGESAPLEIAARIRDATFCVFDISDKADGDPALNTHIEAGIRIGADKPYGLICKGPRRKPPFMFGTKQVEFYDDDAGMIACIRHLCAPYQRILE
jgi:hypothetical protein